MRIVIGADIVPTNNNIEFFCEGDVSKLLDEGVVEVLNSYDYRVCNLETPLCDRLTPIHKCGSNHITPTAAIEAVNQISVDLCAMANNHIMDQGIEGLVSTIKTLERYNINYCGVGNSINEANEIHIFEQNGEKVGVFNCAEHEFSIAGEKKPGANPYDPVFSFDFVSEKKKSVDYLIVLFHGGKEYYQYPSPNLQKACRKFVEKGADLVICQHSHCIGIEEKYQKGTIVYGQGNFIFYDESNQLGKNSLLIGVDTLNNSISYHPIVYKERVSLANKQESEEILNAFYFRSQKAEDGDFLKKEYKKFAYEKSEEYIKILMGKKARSLFSRVLNKFTFGIFNKYLVGRMYDNQSLITILNCVKCEAHNELMIEGLEQRCKATGQKNE